MKQTFLEQIRGNDPLTENPKNVVQGTVSGFPVNATLGANGGTCWRIVIDAKPGGSTPVYPMDQFLMEMKNGIRKVVSATYDGKRIEILLRASTKAGLQIRDILDHAAMYLTQNGYVPCCGSCGGEEPTRLSSINGYMDFMCDSCYDRMCGSLEANKQQLKQKPGNMLTGIVGALLGALLGGVLWVIIYQLGYIAGIAGLVAAVCALKGYEKFGGKINAAGMVICMVIVVVVIYFAQNVGIALALQREFNDYGYGLSFFTVYRAVPELLEESGTTGVFVQDLLIGYALTAVASFATIRSMFQSRTGNYKTGRY